ncbi:MAG: DUF3524 domain-containing protein [Deltaproteobacteria bacterium]|nr:DUF3524 domain-containing protein [Deltaproteobacteria bacterium]
MLNILIIEPYLTGSHATWAKGYQKFSAHKVEILGLQGRYWKWRMHGGAVTLAKKFMEGDCKPDLILATDMLDVTTFLSLTRKRTNHVPLALYFHENQLTYPWSPHDRDIIHKRDRHYGFINYSSALAANTVLFNSDYHKESFLSELVPFLKHFPDYNELETVEEIRKKSSVLHLGLDLSSLDRYRIRKDSGNEKTPLILWNHRWEYDKNPIGFFNALYLLADNGVDFQLAIVGENFRKRPGEFKAAKERLGRRVVQYGYAKSFEEYASWLWKSDIMPVTSNQDFFGGSVIEGIYCNSYPLLPKRLAYPEHIPQKRHSDFFYDDFNHLVTGLEWLIKNIAHVRRQNVAGFAENYKWEKMAPLYDETFDLISKESTPKDVALLEP